MVKEYKNIDLTPMNTMGIKVKANHLVQFDTHDDLRSIFSSEVNRNSRWEVISGGSNIVFTGDFDGLLLNPVSRGLRVIYENEEVVKVKAAAGVEWDYFTQWCVEKNFWGAENLSYIPGYVGASPVQNIGAYGVEAKDIIESVEMFSAEKMSKIILSNEHCNFGYRSSVFKEQLKGRVIITSVNFTLSKVPIPKLGYGDLNQKVQELGEPDLPNIRKAVVDIRRSKLPEPRKMGNSGSFFKNPVVETYIAAKLKEEYPSMPLYPAGNDSQAKLAAGWMIEQCGWKGKRYKNAGVHNRQALILVNLGGATGRDIMELAELIQSDVYKKFGVALETEVNFL